MNTGETLFTGETRFNSFIPSTPSSVIKGAYHDRLMNELVVNFTNGSSYKLAGVDQETYQDFVAASSHGSFFNTRLKGKFQTTKLV
jgi:hypothetical protein